GLLVGKQPQGDPRPSNLVKDPTGDARYEASSTVSPSAPNLDITGSSIAKPAPSNCHPAGVPCIRVSMMISKLDLSAPAPQGDSDENLVWLTQWLTPSASDPRGGRNFFVFAQSTDGGLTCFS